MRLPSIEKLYDGKEEHDEDDGGDLQQLTDFDFHVAGMFKNFRNSKLIVGTIQKNI
jgi:hypothetical protein